MSNYKILEVTISRREDIKKNGESDPPIMTSTVECYLVAHCLFEYMNDQYSCEVDISKIATKTYDENGKIEVVVGDGVPTYEEVEKLLDAVIVDKLKSINAERTYRSVIKSVSGQAEVELSRYFRDSKSGVDLV